MEDLDEDIETAITRYDYGKDTGRIIRPPPGYSTIKVSDTFPVPWAAKPHEGMIESFKQLCGFTKMWRNIWDQHLLASIADWEKTQAEKMAEIFETGTSEVDEIVRGSRRRTGIRSGRRRTLRSLWERESTMSREEEELSEREKRLSRREKKLRRGEKELRSGEKELSRRERRLSRGEKELSEVRERLESLERSLRTSRRKLRHSEASSKRRRSQLESKRTAIESDIEEESDQNEVSTAFPETTVVEE